MNTDRHTLFVWYQLETVDCRCSI